jgi:hypothetical protein
MGSQSDEMGYQMSSNAGAVEGGSKEILQQPAVGGPTQQQPNSFSVKKWFL